MNSQINLSSFEILKNAVPTKKDEAWKFTSLSEFKNTKWSIASDKDMLLTHDQLQHISKNLPSDFYNIVFVNGNLNTTLSDDLSEQIEISAITEQNLKLNENHVDYKIMHMAQSCLNKKLNIKLNAGQVFEKPIHIVYVNSAKNPEFISHKVDVEVGAAAEAQILVQMLSLDLESVVASNLTLNLHLSERANIKLIQIEDENLKSSHFMQTQVTLASDSHFHGFIMALGGHLFRNYFHLEFLGHGAEAGVYGLNALNADQHADHYTFIQHSTGGNESRQLYKSILAGSSHSVFRGRVRIERDAQKANSEQLNNNLLLTREAQADSVPQLEIYADDVKAGHGSTVGQLNKDEIFYFLSRGINQYDAVKMLSFGFAQELIFMFENQLIQSWLLKKLHNKLDRMVEHV